MGSSRPAAIRELLRTRRVYRARLPQTLPPPRWGLGELTGRLVELSAGGASATLTVATGLVLEAQRAGEPVAWIAPGDDGTFYPPDLAESGVDLGALVVIRAPSCQPRAMLTAADRLLRSGAFGLVLLDLARAERIAVRWGGRAEQTQRPAGTRGPATSEATPRALSLPAQTRLAGLAQRHDAVLICLTTRPDPDSSGSLGSLVSLHATATRVEAASGRFCCEVRVVKDKRRGPGWIHRQEGYRGPPGLR
jgi:recombination protein RecA